MSKAWSLAALIVGGIILADLVTHGSQTSGIIKSSSGFESNVGNQLLGK